MAEFDYEAIDRRCFEEIWTHCDLDAVASIYHPDLSAIIHLIRTLRAVMESDGRSNERMRPMQISSMWWMTTSPKAIAPSRAGA